MKRIKIIKIEKKGNEPRTDKNDKHKKHINNNILLCMIYEFSIEYIRN